MAEKLYEYEGCLGRFHSLKQDLRERYSIWKEDRNSKGFFKSLLEYWLPATNESEENEDYSHIYRKKTRSELIRVSAAVMGIEFSYAAETAFVSPTLLKIGVEHQHMTLIWALSPFIGFFLTPILGSLSDQCSLKLGRRRPFIIIMSLGVFIGLILVPNGENMGYAMGDTKPFNNSNYQPSSHRTSSIDKTTLNDLPSTGSHPWGLFFTILGTVLLDFDADACQSPARTFLLDVTIPDDHARGLSTFTIMAGLGGFLGYGLGGINWDVTTIGKMLGGHVKAVFTLITVIFIICVSYTVTSFREMPLIKLDGNSYATFERSEEDHLNGNDENTYGALNNVEEEKSQYISIEAEPKNIQQEPKQITSDPNASLMIYLQSIIYMPQSIKMLCLTNLFCWMAHVCYSLYFTDFVGEAVFMGNPVAPENDISRELYESGVRFGCWGMSIYSLSCACYSTIIEKLINKWGAKKVYVGGLLVYSTGMFLMAVTKHKIGVILFSGTAGVMYSTLFTMPYLIIAHYHSKGIFQATTEGEEMATTQIRGLGTDIAIVSSMVFLAQFILSICMGTIVRISGTTTAVVTVASILAFFGSIAATQVTYLDL